MSVIKQGIGFLIVFQNLAYMTKRDLKSLVLPLFTIVLGKNFSMTKNLLSLRLSSHH